MAAKRNGKKKYDTDRETDYLFEFFINENKFNEQLRHEYDNDIAKKNDNLDDQIKNYPLNLDSRVDVNKKSYDVTESSEKYVELPENSSERNQNVTQYSYNSENANDHNSVHNSHHNSQPNNRSVYGQKITPGPTVNYNQPPVNNTQQNTFGQQNIYGQQNMYKPQQPTINSNYNYQTQTNPTFIGTKPMLGEKLIADPVKYEETAEERRARARDAYSNLQDLVEKYQVKLSRRFTLDDDPDEMEAEYKMHRERRNKTNQVKFYKQVLIGVVSGAEFLNEKYNPFEFRLKDWSKQIATDVDDYTEVLEEIYEKYKEKGGKMPPELRLLFMIIFSGVMFHLSQALFGANGLNNTIRNNPNIINKLMSGLIGGSGSGSMFGNAEPSEARDVSPSANILQKLRQQNRENNQQTSEYTNQNTTTEVSNSNSRSDAPNMTERLLAEERARNELLKQQNEIQLAQLNQLRLNNQNLSTVKPQSNNVRQVPLQTQHNNYSNVMQPPQLNRVLSDVAANLEDDNMLSNYDFPMPIQSDTSMNEEIIFTSDSKANKKMKVNDIDFGDVLESLDSLESSVDNISVSARRRKNNKPMTSVRRKNSATRSTSRRGTDTKSDAMSVSRRGKRIFNI